MSSQIRAMREIEETAVVEFFQKQGIAERVTRWKYYDEAFNKGRNRGYIAVDHGDLVGFIGIIPFLFVSADVARNAVWTCDWYTDRTRPAMGLGLRLLAMVVHSHDLAFHLIGNDISRRILDRLARETLRETAIVLRVTLRLGDLLERFSERAGVRFPWGPLGRFPLWSGLALSSSEPVHIETGVSDAIADVLHLHRPGVCYPKYDREYVDWQIGRCPGLSSFTCLVGTREAARAAAVFWRSEKSTDLWRVAIWPGCLTKRALAGMLAIGIRRVYDLRGVAVSALLSRRDACTIEALRSVGFLERGGVPFDVLGAKNNRPPFHELSGLSYLDDDLAYLF